MTSLSRTRIFRFWEGVMGPKFQFSNKVDEKLNFEWNTAVIVKLMGRPNTANAQQFMFDSLNRKWVTKGPWQLVDLPNGFFALKFQLFEDMDYVLFKSLDYCKSNTRCRMAVWVHILNLLVKYYKDIILNQIGRQLGLVVEIGKVTLGQTRGKFCRLYVETLMNLLNLSLNWMIIYSMWFMRGSL